MSIRTRQITADEFGLNLRALGPDIRRHFTYHAPVDLDHVTHTFVPLMRANAGVAFVAYDDERPLEAVGILFGFILPSMFTKEREALEAGWFVSPCARRDGAALLLLRAFEEFAQAARCVRVLSGSTVEHRSDAMRRWYRRIGYQPHAEAFAKVF